MGGTPAEGPRVPRGGSAAPPRAGPGQASPPGQSSLNLNKNGPTGDIPLRFGAELMGFSTREPEKTVSHVGHFTLSLFPLLTLKF